MLLAACMPAVIKFSASTGKEGFQTGLYSVTSTLQHMKQALLIKVSEVYWGIVLN